MTQSIEIQMLSCNSSTNIADMENITNIVNHVYAASQEGFWKRG